MASLTHDGQTFLIDGKRIWILAASIHYARVAPERWEATIAAAQQAGFNTIDTACPWMLHERRRGKFSFDGQADLRRFVELCAKHGMRVILRPGPFIGHGYDGGGLPPWLSEIDGLMPRQANEPFIEAVGQYFRKLCGEISDLQVTQGGPIILFESEHAWVCANENQGASYLHEVTRVLRECGITVPIFNSNDLWQPAADTIDTWRGFDDMLGHMRQLRVVQPEAPRLVSTFDASRTAAWGIDPGAAHEPQRIVQRLAQVLAGGAQVIVDPFHGGTNFGFMGGRLAGGPDRFAASSAVARAPLGEVGARMPGYHAMRRLITFANQFSAVFMELDPAQQSACLAVNDVEGKGGGRDVSIVTLAGRAGRVVFVFRNGAASRQQPSIPLLLHDGTTMPVTLGEASVGWFLFDADLAGAGKLDYTNLCLFAVVDRSLLVMHGPAKSMAAISIAGGTFRGEVPSGPKPLVVDHRGLTLVICNQSNIDTTYFDKQHVYVGASGIDAHGDPIPESLNKPVWVISKGAVMRKWQPSVNKPPAAESDAPSRGKKGGKTKVIAAAAPMPPPSQPRMVSGPASIALRSWSAAPAIEYASGTSPRFATLEGPRTLSACGAQQGYGWYRIELRSKTARSRLLALPSAGDRVHLYMHGKLERLIGAGPGATLEPIAHKFAVGEVVMSMLADNLGRCAEGSDLDDPKGVFGHVFEVKPLRSVRPKIADAALVHPFALREFIAFRTYGQLSEAEQVIWRFSHARKNPILLDLHSVSASGTIVLNDQPVAYYAGAAGCSTGRVLLDPTSMEAMRRGKNVLRFAPDTRQSNAADEVAKRAKLYECVETISDGARWSFARWEPPIASSYRETSSGDARSLRGVPCWWRTHVEVTPHELPRWFDTNGLSKGQVFINGKNLGRYFTATRDGKSVGPQRRLHVPDSLLKINHNNEIVVFDEHGFTPHHTAIVARETGDLD